VAAPARLQASNVIIIIQIEANKYENTIRKKDEHNAHLPHDKKTGRRSLEH
jgi:hypothetical protein